MAVITTSCKRIELAYLKKSKILVKGQVLSSTLSWSNGSSISIKTYYTEEDKYLLLNYTINEELEMSYKIRIREVPSNLGKGNVPYMVCPMSGKLCRKLYMAYGSNHFKSIKAYKNRIYYRGQLSPSNNYNDKYWSLLNHLETKPTKRWQTHYNGIPTKRYLREIELDDKLEYFDEMRFSQLNLNAHFR